MLTDVKTLGGLLLALAAFAGPVSAARPPDLPVPVEQEFEPETVPSELAPVVEEAPVTNFYNPAVGAAIGAAVGAGTVAVVGTADDTSCLPAYFSQIWRDLVFWLGGDTTSPSAALLQKEMRKNARQIGIEDVVSMMERQVSDDCIIHKIRQTQSSFNLTANDVVWLKQNGVSDEVVQEMLIWPQPAGAAPMPLVIFAPVGQKWTDYVVTAVQLGVCDDFIIQWIRLSQATVNLTADDVIWLKQKGVSDRVVQELQARQQPAHEAESTHEITDSERFLQKMCQAQKMYHEGERCRTRGDLDEAYKCYQQTQRLCPHSDYAHLAAKRMHGIDVLRQIEQPEDESEKTDEHAQPAETEQGNDAREMSSDVSEFGVDLGFQAPIISTRSIISDCPTQQAQAARAAETGVWLVNTLQLLGGNTRVDLDINTSDTRGVRLRGGIHFGVLGCDIICEGDTCRFVWPGASEE